ncbi:MAG: type II/IV secretion system protein [Planctomycetes bacterium]|nr:type II/IV secretion system protein [Planctomycetota bacterium]
MKLPFKHIKKVTDIESDGGERENCADGMLMRGLSNLYSPESSVSCHTRDVADVLMEMGRLSAEQVEQIRSDCQAKETGDIEQFIISKSIVDKLEVLEARAKLCDLEFRRIEVCEVEEAAFERLDIVYIRSNHMVPVSEKDGVLVVATSRPEDIFVADDVMRQTDLTVKMIVCPQDDIDAACNELEGANKTEYNFDELISDMAEIEVVQDEEEESEDLEKSAGRSPVINFVNYLISSAIQEGASDIHIEPKEKYTKIRQRIDGALFESKEAPAKMHPAIISRLKIMANLDISERRLPQDGKISVIMNSRGIDLRISILPTSHGEKAVIRILDSNSLVKGLEFSGMEPEVLTAFRGQIILPHGILLVTGPTGSGKSTTLYSALAEMDSSTLNVSTVEDPVEYDLEFCNQVQANERIGLTFASALRSLLRQDPDIIMIGEVRDSETARIAVQAALTGHLVLSTLHTNDAPSTISRLVDIGVEPYLIAASLNAVLAQRLVRRICGNCKEPYQVPDNMRCHVETAGISPDEIVIGAGCDQCRQSGYVGRAGIFELMVMDDKFKDIINSDSSQNNMTHAFIESGCATLFDDGMRKVRDQVTTIEEVLRVTEVYDRSENT